MNNILQTKRLTLRRPDARDTAIMIDFFMSDRARFYGGSMNPSEAWHKFAAYVGQWTLSGFGFYAITLKNSDDIIGMVGPHFPSHFPEPELSWLLTDAAHEGKGYAAEAAIAVRDYVLGEDICESLVSYIDHDNTASIALAQRMGARLDKTANAPIENCLTYRHPSKEEIQ